MAATCVARAFVETFRDTGSWTGAVEAAMAGLDQTDRYPSSPQGGEARTPAVNDCGRVAIGNCSRCNDVVGIPIVPQSETPSFVTACLGDEVILASVVCADEHSASSGQQ